MAAAEVMTNRHIVGTILHHLSGMKYKDRRQYGPDQPVEFLEFRPTLVPSILVNKLWADEGTSILWRRYPHLPALKEMALERRQYYANKVHQLFAMSPAAGHADTLAYLDELNWPNLKSLELEVDFQRHGVKFMRMLHPNLETLELLGYQSGDSRYFAEMVLPAVFGSCSHLKRIQFSPETIADDDPLHASALFEHWDSTPSVRVIELKATNFIDKDALFTRLSQRVGFEALEIDLDPGLALLPLLSGLSASSLTFASLKRLNVMCYPEIALALPVHLHVIEELQFDLARIPDRPVQEFDSSLLEDLISRLTHCSRLRMLRVGIGLLAVDFPSPTELPTLSGTAMVRLAETCSVLEDINLYATEPSAFDGSSITAEDFDLFCNKLPRLRNLSLKFHPNTTTALEMTAIQSLGEHCRELEMVRVKIACQLPSLPVPNRVPQILINGVSTPSAPSPGTTMDSGTRLSLSDSGSVPASPHTSIISPLFPRLTHLAISRPESILFVANDSATVSSASHSASDIIDPDLEADLVRSWAHPLLAHFPRLEILEAWGDWTGEDNESLNYFLPTEEILASTWEFLSGIEQDLWEDDESASFGEGESWQMYESGSGEDWDKASLMNEYPEGDLEADVSNLNVYEEEPDGMATPGRTPETDQFFDQPSNSAVKDKAW